MNEKPNYYAIIPADVRYDKKLKDKAKLLYGEITALSNEKGYCWATNEYFANLYNVTTRTITDLISNLSDSNYIQSEIVTKENKSKRIIKIMEGRKNLLGGIEKNFYQGIEENFQLNNTSINNTRINNKEKSIKRNFEKPTISEIEQYCEERNNGINANAFYDFYESKNWYVGKNKMKDWKACVRTWEQRQTSQQPKKESFDDMLKRFREEYENEC